MDERRTPVSTLEARSRRSAAAPERGGPDERFGCRGARHLVELTPDRLEVRLGWDQRLVHGFLALLSAGVCLPLPVFWAVEVYQGTVRRPPAWTAWFFAGLGTLGLVFLVLGLWTAFDLGRLRFDRVSRRMTWPRLPGFGPAIGLQGVLAVQLTAGGARGRSGSRKAYQVNLVFEQPRPPRLHLLEDGDLGRARRVGQQLARFLSVRVLDQAGAGATGPWHE